MTQTLIQSVCTLLAIERVYILNYYNCSWELIYICIKQEFQWYEEILLCFRINFLITRGRKDHACVKKRISIPLSRAIHNHRFMTDLSSPLVQWPRLRSTIKRFFTVILFSRSSSRSLEISTPCVLWACKSYKSIHSQTRSSATMEISDR